MVRVTLRGVDARMAFPPDWDTGGRELREHLFYFVAAGRCRFEGRAGMRLLGPGCLCWVMPGEPFRFRAVGGGGRLIRCRATVLAGRARPRLVAPAVVVEEAWELVPWIQALAAEAGRARARARGRARGRLVLAVLSRDMLAKRRRGGKGWEERFREGLAARAWRWSPGGMAAEAGLTLDYFARRFRAVAGVAPRAWLVRERMRWAAVLLEETRSRVGEVGRAVGCENAFLFSRQFKQAHGCAPREWRGRKTGAAAPLAP